jgi:hypothetical protein
MRFETDLRTRSQGSRAAASQPLRWLSDVKTALDLIARAHKLGWSAMARRIVTCQTEALPRKVITVSAIADYNGKGGGGALPLEPLP